jgi:hypothetical protein
MNEHIDNAESLLSPQVSGSTPPPSEENMVKLWIKRIKDAKQHFEDDFKRMREDMEFAAMLQWQGQQAVNDKEDRYIANFITNHVNQKVASLYAKQPEAEAKVRKRLNYEHWDGEVATEQQARMVLQNSMMTGQVTPDAAQAVILLQDIARGRLEEQRIARVSKTLEVLYEYECDIQEPDFKKQMKQLVRRVVTTGVGFVRVNYVEANKPQLMSTLTNDTLAFRLQRAKDIMLGIEADRIEESDPRVEQLKILLNSVESSVIEPSVDVDEKVEFDFPSATSIIVDPRCKALKGFIGANWIAQQFIMSLDDANTYFGLTGENKIKPGGDFVEYAEDCTEKVRPTGDTKPDDIAKTPRGCFWEVFDYASKTSFFVCDGWKWFVTQPAPVHPDIHGFWPVKALTFNDVEVEAGQKVHVYPPSDVRLLMSMQKERNRSRQELREHRQVNRPFFWTMKGWATEDDLGKFADHKTGELIQLAGQPTNGDMKGAIGFWSGTPIDQNVYSTAPLDEDAHLAVGTNQVQSGGPIRHVAATPAVIQEQARISGVSSNVDDLDDLLSDMARSAGEIMLKMFSPETVKRIVGIGAVWPDQERADFINCIYLDIVAASSGRPNKAVDIQNAQQLAPLMLQAGANPWAIIKYLVKVSDANLDPSEFAPVMPPAPMQGQPQANNARQHPGNVGSHEQDQRAPAGVQQGGLH